MLSDVDASGVAEVSSMDGTAVSMAAPASTLTDGGGGCEAGCEAVVCIWPAARAAAVEDEHCVGHHRHTEANARCGEGTAGSGLGESGT